MVDVRWAVGVRSLVRSSIGLPRQFNAHGTDQSKSDGWCHPPNPDSRVPLRRIHLSCHSVPR
ncbi:hypothetical protein RESH_05878 [Rhodopirellula europaea SH398]|uniref:Uncharacterized protein n=1 Tax=Rhodopirellula europaea SH398 TaxID=1263868 RepID=M5RWH0_9BACT|nr:hypothetical protein RESH_05878 [Rhodopirellula europaea SH398]